METRTSVTKGKKFSNIIVILILLLLFYIPSSLARQNQSQANQSCTAEARPIGRKTKSKERRVKREARSAKGQELRANGKQAKADDSIGICTVPSKG
jgi:competence protein ComGC